MSITSLLRRISAGHLAVVIASAALFVALDGPSQASGLITGKQIKNSSVTGKDVKKDSLTGDDIGEATLGKVPSATAADSANGVVANSVTGAGVADRSLSAADYAVGSGSFTVDLDSVPAQECQYTAVDVHTDLQNASIVVTPPSNFGGIDISVTAVHSNAPGPLRVMVCNPTVAAIDPPSATFSWIGLQ
jgi:hypothetical protein